MNCTDLITGYPSTCVSTPVAVVVYVGLVSTTILLLVLIILLIMCMRSVAKKRRRSGYDFVAETKQKDAGTKLHPFN
jgi:hypothetical protein